MSEEMPTRKPKRASGKDWTVSVAQADFGFHIFGYIPTLFERLMFYMSVLDGGFACKSQVP